MNQLQQSSFLHQSRNECKNARPQLQHTRFLNFPESRQKKHFLCCVHYRFSQLLVRSKSNTCDGSFAIIWSAISCQLYIVIADFTARVIIPISKTGTTKFFNFAFFFDLFFSFFTLLNPKSSIIYCIIITLHFQEVLGTNAKYCFYKIKKIANPIIMF